MPDKTLRPTIERLLDDAIRQIDRLDAELLLAHVLRTDRVWLRTNDDVRPPSANARAFRDLVERRKKHEPVAHLTHEKEFYGRPFFVSRHVLIPRPDTELLVEIALKRVDHQPVIWDVGTGSGAIAITLTREHLSATVLATDVSSRALTAARVNAKRHQATDRMTFLKSDLLQPAAYRWLKKQSARHHQLLIAANLPYLPTSDKKVLAKDVVKYEPSLALFSGSDGLTLIKRFLGQLARHLPELGYRDITLLFEYDPPQTKKLTALVRQLFPKATVRIHRDLAKHNRLLEISISH